MWKGCGYEEERYVHEESWQSENEHYSYGSGMQMMPTQHSPLKPSKHQMVVNGANNTHHDGWNKPDMASKHQMMANGDNSMHHDAWNKPSDMASKHQMMANGASNMHHDGWNKQNMAQHGWNKPNIVKHGWTGGGGNLFGKQKPHYSMNQSQFSHANMNGGYGKQGSNGYHQMHPSTHSVIVEEEVMYEEHSSWQTNGGGSGGHYDKNWMHNGYNNPQYCMSKAV